MKLTKALRKTEEIETEINEIPWSVWTCFWYEQPKVSLAGDQLSFGSDYKNLSELREGVEWLVDQLGGEVTWKK